MGRSPCFDKLHMKREALSEDQDSSRRSAYMPRNFAALSKKPELGRFGKSCRLRRSDYLKPGGLQQESFTPQEEDLIIKLHATIGSRWFIIAQQLPGRTDNDVKNIWNTKLRKKLTAMGIDPVTHRPFSQILADYGNIGAIPKARTRFGSLSRNIKTAAFTLRSDNSQDHSAEASDLEAPGQMEHHHHHQPHQDYFLISSNDAVSSSNSQSQNLLSQLQAIKLVTEASNYANSAEYMNPHVISDFSSPSAASSSSSECPSTSTNQAAASPAFNWCDFLLEEASPLGNSTQEHGNNSFGNSPTPVDHMHQEEVQNSLSLPAEDDIFDDVQMDNNKSFFEASMLPSSSGSFVEAILESEHEMLLDFQGLSEEPFYY